MGGAAAVLLGVLCVAVFAGGRAKALSDRALAESEARFREVIESLPQLVWTSRADGACDFVSARWCEYSGMDVGSALGLGWTAAVHPDDRDGLAAAWRAALAAGTPVAHEARFRRRDGSYRWFDCRAVALRGSDGRVERWFGANTDVDDAHRVLEALAAEQALLARVAATAPGAIYSFHMDASGSARFPYVSPRMAELVGLPAEALAASAAGVEERIHPDDRGPLLDKVGHARADGAPWRDEFRLLHPTRGERWLEVSAIGEPTADGGSQWFGHLIDVTERKLAEERATRAQKMEALGTLAGGVAHDFNNLLVAIIGNTELAQAELPRDAPVQPFLAEVLRASARAADLVRRILAFSRKEGSSRVRTPLAALLREAVQMLRSTLPANVALTLTTDADAPEVMASPSQLHQVILNLVTNAAHAIGSRRGAIEVRLGAATVASGRGGEAPPELPPGAYAVVAVADDGAGIDPAVLGRIFDPFFTTKPQGQGTGLGLSTVHGIVRDHGGAIRVASELGRGATFQVWLPAAPTAVCAAATVRPSGASRLPRGHGERVFFVDDEEPLTTFASRALEQLGYRPRVFSNPVAALEAVREQPEAIDLLITDLTMPQMSGFELVRAVREVRPDLPIVLSSGFLQQCDVEEADRLRVTELLAKPTRLEEFARAVAVALEGEGARPSG
ncbi:MAG: PAS domain-containing protein [Deltaproteobacteria bacterium]|nr:PAS domain-containing protein [Deltaproteobacteria bacterium]